MLSWLSLTLACSNLVHLPVLLGGLVSHWLLYSPIVTLAHHNASSDCILKLVDPELLHVHVASVSSVQLIQLHESKHSHQLSSSWNSSG